MTFTDLEGKTIKEVKMDCEKSCIEFVTDQGILSYETYAYCCSESWINHISGLEAIIGEKVLKTDEINMYEISEGEEGFSDRQEVDRVYSYKIFTSQGVCEIEMRNASNGYYGGFIQKVSKIDCETVPIIENF